MNSANVDVNQALLAKVSGDGKIDRAVGGAEALVADTPENQTNVLCYDMAGERKYRFVMWNKTLFVRLTWNGYWASVRWELAVETVKVHLTLIKAFKKLPLLEELRLTYTYMSEEAIEVADRCCPNLKSFSYNQFGLKQLHIVSDYRAEAIARNMPNLCHLQLIGNALTNYGLQTILDKCPRLESLDLQKCFNVSLEGDLDRRCSEQIKDLRRLDDSTKELWSEAVTNELINRENGANKTR
ncbi:hypothetical protein RJ640_007312 [Escallonia rubra]|uniref:F-box/LRR-repeat protein 23 n=1 Tax=Escallonia rubra TaxID=112253 RepID=A0AA88UUI1_9ASTE|nr:hypothetical protein RJ640_007312 [Escallonia rubra]